MKSFRTVVVAFALSCLLFAQAVDVGSGPISEGIRQEFVRAYFRNTFQNLVSVPPLGNVRRLGTGGLVQEFADASGNENNRYALVRNTLSETIASGPGSTFQVFPRLYTAYTGIGPNTAGYPNIDTNNCPVVNGRACTFQTFTLNYALFAYTTATLDGTTVTVKDPFFTKWRATGGIGGLGPATGAEQTLTSGAGSSVTSISQAFAGGSIFSITSGTLEGRIVAVLQPVFDVYAANGGVTGFLGLPTSDEIRQTDGKRRQTFEGGVIEYEAGGTPVLRLPVASVVIRTAAPVQRVNLGDTFRLEAQTFAGNGSTLEGRAITWASSNSRVLAVTPSGASVSVRAVGGGSATITAISEGKASRGITFFVNAPCCQIGEGAPNSAAEQAFLDAVTRNRIDAKVPAPTPVRRVGNGLVQETVSASNPNVRYLLAKPDAQVRAFLVTGALLARYLEMGGPGGALGYPLGDPTARGRQVFEGGALGGDPVQAVTGGVLARWASQTYEAGPAGLPAGPRQQVLSFVGTLGDAQTFAGGVIVAHATGANGGRAFLVSGLVLAKYVEAGGPAGQYGFPTGEEFSVSGLRRQEFEGAVIEYSPGDGAAAVRELERRPRISATPGTVSAGSRIRIAAGGFPSGATLRVKVGTQPDFIASTVTGAYAWEVYVPANAPSGVVTLRAAHVDGTAIAVGSYVVQSTSETLARVTKLRGDLQTGVPGGRLAQPFRIAVKDENGTPLVGIPVRFTPSPGAVVEQASTITDDRGEAQAYLRMPLAELPALATAEAGRQVVTFSARAQARTLRDYPRFSQGGQTGDTKLGNETSTIAQKGALLVASASMLRYMQDSGAVGSPNGLADPLLLNTFLKDLCLFDAEGNQVCDGFLTPAGAAENNVNPWRLPAFVSGGLDLQPVPLRVEAIRDALALDTPVLIALEMREGEGEAAALAGSHFVVAIGVAANGAIQVHDPNPALSRQTLEEYGNGVTVNGRLLRGTVAAAVRMAAGAPSALGFLVMSVEPAGSAGAGAQVFGAAGQCGFGAAWADVTVAASGAVTRAAQRVRYSYCDGQEASYQLQASGDAKLLLSDLGTVAGRFELAGAPGSAFRLTRPQSNWAASPLALEFRAEAVVNAASFTADVAPGSLVSIFGSGLFLAGRATVAELDGTPLAVVSGTPFQLNVAIPPDVTPGAHRLTIRSPFGEQSQTVNLRGAAPALFELGNRRGAVLNQNGTINSEVNPGGRGQVLVLFATGLGAVEGRGGLQVATTLPRVSVGGREVPVAFAGLAPGFLGLYQLNIVLPEDLAPGLGLEVVVQQGDQRSNTVLVAVQ